MFAPAPARLLGLSLVDKTCPPGRVRSSAEEHYLDMVGVTGSIPVAPTIRTTENRLFLVRFALAALARGA